MSERLAVLVALVAAGALFLLFYGWYRRRSAPLPERLDVDALGLELMSGCCAFVVFTSPACKPCKAALRAVSDAVARRDGATEIATIDAVERSDVAIRSRVRSIPTVFLITASGHVIGRWTDVPVPAELDDALTRIEAEPARDIRRVRRERVGNRPPPRG